MLMYIWKTRDGGAMTFSFCLNFCSSTWCLLEDIFGVDVEIEKWRSSAARPSLRRRTRRPSVSSASSSGFRFAGRCGALVALKPPDDIFVVAATYTWSDKWQTLFKERRPTKISRPATPRGCTVFFLKNRVMWKDLAKNFTSIKKKARQLETTFKVPVRTHFTSRGVSSDVSNSSLSTY